MIKDTIKRKKPSFNETYHGYRTFSELLEDAQKEGLIELEIDKRSKTYVVTRFDSELKSDAPMVSHATKKRRRRSTRGRSGRGRERTGTLPFEGTPVGEAAATPAPREDVGPAPAKSSLEERPASPQDAPQGAE
jgi:hypothetical protein